MERILKKNCDEFFVDEGVVYFKVSHYFPKEGEEGEIVEKWFSQSGGKVTAHPSAPTAPDAERGTFDDGECSLTVGDYNGQAISVLYRNADAAGYVENMGLVDGLLRIDGGYMIHAIEGRAPSRKHGLLYWPDGSNRMDHMGRDAGQFWLIVSVVFLHRLERQEILIRIQHLH